MNDEKKQARFIIVNENELDLFQGKTNALYLYLYLKMNQNFNHKDYRFVKSGKEHHIKPHHILTSTRILNKKLNLHRTVIKKTAEQLRDLGVVEFEITKDGYLFEVLTKRKPPKGGTESVQGGTETDPQYGTESVPYGGTESVPQNNIYKYKKLNNSLVKKRESNILRETTGERARQSSSSLSLSNSFSNSSSHDQINKPDTSENRSDQPPFDLIELDNNMFIRKGKTVYFADLSIDEKNYLLDLEIEANNKFAKEQSLKKKELENNFTNDDLQNLAEDWFQHAQSTNKNFKFNKLEFQQQVYKMIFVEKVCSFKELRNIFDLKVRIAKEFWNTRLIQPKFYKSTFTTNAKSKHCNKTLLQVALEDLK